VGKGRTKMKIKPISIIAPLFTIFVLVTQSVYAYERGMKGVDPEKIVEKAKNLALDNELFFKGLHGLIAPNVYIRKGDQRNSLYDSKDEIFKGRTSNIPEAVHLEKPAGKIAQINQEAALKIRSGVLVVFSPNAIYVLDFDQRRFGWYPRGEMIPRTNRAPAKPEK